MHNNVIVVAHYYSIEYTYVLITLDTKLSRFPVITSHAKETTPHLFKKIREQVIRSLRLILTKCLTKIVLY